MQDHNPNASCITFAPSQELRMDISPEGVALAAAPGALTVGAR